MSQFGFFFKGVEGNTCSGGYCEGDRWRSQTGEARTQDPWAKEWQGADRRGTEEVKDSFSGGWLLSGAGERIGRPPGARKISERCWGRAEAASNSTTAILLARTA